MSTKTIAVDSRVYNRLSAVKKEGESFSKLIDRLLTEVGSAYTGRDILSRIATISSLSDADARVFLDVVAENHRDEKWNRRDLR